MRNNDTTLITEDGEKNNNEKTYSARYPSVMLVGAIDSDEDQHGSFRRYEGQE